MSMENGVKYLLLLIYIKYIIDITLFVITV